MASDPAGVTNPAVRAALDALAADPDGGAGVDVLRWCLQGFLLLDVTGSELRSSADGTEADPGSTVRIATMTGPDGGSALAAFTSTAEIEKVHRGAGAAVQSLAQPATAVLELAIEHGHDWLCLDPGELGCALSRDELEFALRVPRNDAVRQALDVVHADPGRRADLLDTLRADGVFVLAVDRADVAGVVQGELDADTPVQIRTTTLPDGRAALLVFASGPEAAARVQTDSFVVWSTAEVHQALRDGDLAGVVVNPAGPWAAVTNEELFGSASI